MANILLLKNTFYEFVSCVLWNLDIFTPFPVSLHVTMPLLLCGEGKLVLCVFTDSPVFEEKHSISLVHSCAVALVQCFHQKVAHITNCNALNKLAVRNSVKWSASI